jgi:hypothetical protein
LNPQDLVGNNQRQNIKPKIIIFDDATIKDVPKKFAELIVVHNLHQNKGSVFKAIGWRKTATENTGFTIGSYFDNYQVSSYKNKVDFENLSDYLMFNESSLELQGFVITRRNILNGIVKALRVAGVKKSDSTHFTVQSFLIFLKENYEKEYNELKMQLYKWSCSIHKNIDIHNLIKTYIIGLLNSVFRGNGNVTQNVNLFLNAPNGNNQTSQPTPQSLDNIFRYKSQNINIDIEISTIHTIKGETHTATLYLETYYYNDAGKSYESQRLIEQLKGNRVNNCGVRVKESLKMAYVGMSRPTDLLCMAVHKSHIPSSEIVNLQNNWEFLSIC